MSVSPDLKVAGGSRVVGVNVRSIEWYRSIIGWQGLLRPGGSWPGFVLFRLRTDGAQGIIVAFPQHSADYYLGRRAVALGDRHPHAGLTFASDTKAPVTMPES